MGKKIVSRDLAMKTERYIKEYEKLFDGLENKDIKLFELGILQGNSLLMWRDYFEKGIIVGLDIDDVKIPDETGRIKTYKGSQDDFTLLTTISNEIAPEGFDIIIDDASHMGNLTRKSFWHLFENHLKSGGIYVIEDWGTGYWQSWPDGKAFVPGQPHFAGMVGFIKELVDECGVESWSAGKYNAPPARITKFTNMQILFGQVFITKR